VHLFDYDAVERLTDVKVRTNSDREPGEETVPDWFFEDGVVFLPEELEYGMQLRVSWRVARSGRKTPTSCQWTIGRLQRRLRTASAGNHNLPARHRPQ